MDLKSAKAMPTCPVNDNAVVNDSYQDEGYVFFMHWHTDPDSSVGIVTMLLTERSKNRCMKNK
jgi:hypothetical protein